MVLSTYGRSTGFCLDPIEKKPLNHFLPGTATLSFGTAGCNLGCKYCQNWATSKARATAVTSQRAGPEAIAQAARASGAASVAFTYNDPVLWAEYAIDTARACHERAVKTVAVTAGYITERARPEFFEHIDAANVDLKAFTERFYRRLCLAELAPVLDTLKWIKHQSDVWLEITTLVIPGHNDGDDELARLAGWIASELGPTVPLHLTAFHPDFRMLDVPATHPATLTRARKLALAEGLRYVYTGNVHDSEGQSTFCPGCSEVLIGRDRYLLDAWNLRAGRCANCGYALEGTFDSKPGDWRGGRRAIGI